MNTLPDCPLRGACETVARLAELPPTIEAHPDGLLAQSGLVEADRIAADAMSEQNSDMRTELAEMGLAIGCSACTLYTPAPQEEV
jgi:hypothetical protein